jgi:formylmethanofuran dehydrogenase subunit B
MSQTRTVVSDGPAWIDGATATLDEAVAEAARLLMASRQPLIAGLGADVEGARAAILLAERLGGVVEHSQSETVLRDLDCLRETGVMVTTPNEARVRADVLLMVGDGLEEAWPALNDRLLRAPARPHGEDVARRVVWLAPQADSVMRGVDGGADILVAGRGTTLAANLAVLRARVKGRRIVDASVERLEAIAATLKSAHFGVTIWIAASLGALEIEMINGLVRDLNEATRFSGLPLAAPENAAGVMEVCGWMTGFPMRTGFGGGAPTHDPWRFDAARLIAGREADCVMWISAFGARPPDWGDAIQVALCDRATVMNSAPKVRIEVARPGVDHDAVLHSADTGTLVAVDKSAAPLRGAPSVAEALARISQRLQDASA